VKERYDAFQQIMARLAEELGSIELARIIPDAAD
jgi:hypothetical protein